MAIEEFKFHFNLRVRWSECDAQGIVFNGRYLDYLEVAQSEYYRNLGFRLYDARGRRYFDTASVKATLEFKAPARVDQLLDVYTRISSIGNTSIVMRSEIYRSGSTDLLLKGEIVYADYDAEAGTSRRVPEDIRDLVGHFEETGEVLPIEQFPNLAPL